MVKQTSAGNLSDASRYEAEEILRDGGSIHIRAIRPDDKPRLIDHFRRLSQRSVYFRFFGVKKRLTDEELSRFTEPDFVSHVGLVATLREGEEERIIWRKRRRQATTGGSVPWWRSHGRLGRAPHRKRRPK